MSFPIITGRYNPVLNTVEFPKLHTYLKEALPYDLYKDIESKANEFDHLADDNYQKLNKFIGTIRNDTVFNAVQSWKYQLVSSLYAYPKGTRITYH